MRVVYLDRVDSTNDEAFRRLEAGEAAHLDLLVAREQTAGRGRRGRAWVGSPGESFLGSLVLMGADADDLPGPSLLSMAAGVALVDAAEEVGVAREDLALDWPNDLVVLGPDGWGGHRARGDGTGDGPGSDEVPAPVGEAPKLAGILVEARSLDPAAPVYVVGLGVNLLQRTFPAELLAERPVASLAQLGVPVEPERFAPVLGRCLAEAVTLGRNDPSELCARYLDATRLGGLEVELELAGGRPRGRLVFAEPDGLGLLDDEDGLLRFALEHVLAIRPA